MTNRSYPTARQQEVLEFISNFITDHGHSPSYREIQASLGYKTVGTVAKHINALVTEGWLQRQSNKARSLTVVNREDVVGRRWLQQKIKTLKVQGVNQEQIDILQKGLDILSQ